MKSFKQHYNLILEFFDSIDNAVKHIDHLEENILNKGKQGVMEALKQIEASISYFVDESDYKISTKFDGAPAVVAGVDPNGRFFVASKSAFAKNPKINYTKEDIVRNHGQGGLANKLAIALDYLPSLNLKGIYQMDYMFDNEIKQIEQPNKIDGVKNENRFITFQPNTIKYAVSPDSPYGQQILQAKLGVAVHIEYMIQNGILKVKKYTTSPSEFTPSKTVFIFNVLANKPKNSKSAFSKMLLKDVQSKKRKVLSLAEKTDFSSLADYAIELKTYINHEIRQGRFLEDTNTSTAEFINYMEGKYQKEISKLREDLASLRTEKGKERKENSIKKKQEDAKNNIREIRALKSSIRNALEITKIIATLKDNLVKIFNEITKSDVLGTYLPDEKEANSWQTTSPEGFALSKVGEEGAEITKMVQRQEFSRANFERGGQFSQPQQPNENVPPVL